ncbi:MAG: RDD family protein [Puniceicoccaceae bacterium]
MLENETSTNEFDLSSMRLAGFGIRLAAYLIDFLILLIPTVGAYFMSSVGGYLLLAIPMIAYKPLLDGMLGGTAGKLALGIRVINVSGQHLGIAGGFVRSGLFILPSIPGIVTQIKMIEQGIPKMDPEAISAFQEANAMLNIASYVFIAIMIISCIVVAFHKQKRGLHDLIADSYVIYLDKPLPKQ